MALWLTVELLRIPLPRKVSEKIPLFIAFCVVLAEIDPDAIEGNIPT